MKTCIYQFYISQKVRMRRKLSEKLHRVTWPFLILAQVPLVNKVEKTVKKQLPVQKILYCMLG